jgi:hypothetical protein
MEKRMNIEAIMKRIGELPPEGQQEAADFIQFLWNKYAIPDAAVGPDENAEDEVSFFGMWANREDMADSAAWVKELRRREWERPR